MLLQRFVLGCLLAAGALGCEAEPLPPYAPRPFVDRDSSVDKGPANDAGDDAASPDEPEPGGPTLAKGSDNDEEQLESCGVGVGCAMGYVCDISTCVHHNWLRFSLAWGGEKGGDSDLDLHVLT